MKRYLTFLMAIVVISISQQTAAFSGTKIIYHSDHASGYTLPALMVSALRRPDFITVPVVLSRDNVPVIYPDLLLQTRTDVKEIFPERHRADGNYYVVDFSLQELRRLSYLGDDGQFSYRGAHMASLEEVFTIIDLLAGEFDTPAEFLPVIKYPWFYANEGKDISSVVLNALIAHAASADATLSCMCYDPDELQRISSEILPGLPVTVRLIQATDHIGGGETMRESRREWTSYNDEWIFTRLGLRVVSSYASALWVDDVQRLEPPVLKRLIADSQGLEMDVYLRVPHDSDDLFAATARELITTYNADGLAVANPAKLRELFASPGQDDGSAQSPPATLGEGQRQQRDNPGEGLLRDPEGLLERLRQMQ